MDKKKTFWLVVAILVLVLAGMGVYKYLAKLSAERNKPKTGVVINTSFDVCNYINGQPDQKKIEGTEQYFERCQDNACTARDRGTYWEASYSCPPSDGTLIIPTYTIQVDKQSQEIKVTGVSK